MLSLREPVRIITKSTILSLSAGAMLLGILSENGMKCALRAIQNYTKNERESILHEDYKSLICIDCSEKDFSSQSTTAQFLDATAVYDELDFEKEKFAHVGIIGIVATAHEHNQSVIIPDQLLQDGLKTQIMNTEIKELRDIDNAFFESLTIQFHGARMKIIEVASLVSATARMGKTTVAVSALLGDTNAQSKVVQHWGEFQRELAAAFEWCKKNEKEIYRYMGVSIINMKDFAAPHLTGSIAAHFAKESKSFALVMAYAADKRVRVSLRCHNQDTIQLLSKILEGIDCEYGGDTYEAGGSFFRDDEEQFVSAAKKVLEKACVEESV